jgi:uncharacterized surface protein with fasciclin (FAS1) repeats
VLSLPPLPSERIKTQPLATQPNEFSTLEKAFNALDYWDTIDSTVGRTGGTLFAPTNDAFEKMGAETVDYLFNTDEGLAYLKAILDFHVIVNHTLFSNAYYAGSLEERFMESKPTSVSATLSVKQNSERLLIQNTAQLADPSRSRNRCSGSKDMEAPFGDGERSDRCQDRRFHFIKWCNARRRLGIDARKA